MQYAMQQPQFLLLKTSDIPHKTVNGTIRLAKDYYKDNILFFTYQTQNKSYIFVNLHPTKRNAHMNAFYTILLLIGSNIFMTLAWYGHLKLQQAGVSNHWPLIGVIAFSWIIAFFEYCLMVPANRIGFEGNGGPFNLMQLKVIQEVISLVVFTVVATMLFQGQPLHWNHLAAFVCLILAVYFVFL